MTERLYYRDARLTRFDAYVTQVSADGRQVHLDRSAFYPTSGGQPFDTGTLAGIPVVDVIDADDEIIHVLGREYNGGMGAQVEGIVDWQRRFDHMQQHTGQHLLSALFADRYDAPTVSVHFGAAYSTVDVAAKSAISEDTVSEVEQLANEIVAANRAVTVSFEDAASATGLRKPSDRPGELRIITIEDTDRSACGGTHVDATGEIGGMLLRRFERTKGYIRIEFLCGLRAVRAARSDYLTLQQASRVLSAAPAELPVLVETNQQRIRELEREQRRLQEELAQFRAREIWAAHDAERDGLRRIRLHIAKGQARDLQPIATAIAKLGSAVVLATAADTKSVLLATSEDSGVDAGKEIKQLMTRHGGSGGGSPRVAQGKVSTDDALGAIVGEMACTTTVEMQ